MARRTKIADTEKLFEALLEDLKAFHAMPASSDLRNRILKLVGSNHLLRDLGISIMPDSSLDAARERILFYLRKHVSHVVHGDELMVVSGISEYARRIRELRVEHGWQILSGNTLKDMKKEEEDQEAFKNLPDMKPDEYLLLNADPDTDAAARWKAAKSVRADKTLSVRDKILKYLRANVGTPVSGEELKYLAKDKSEWARRVRELRTEFGWSVVTKVTGRPDLPVGIYVLEDERQAPEHDRHIKDDVRGKVLRRDNYTCQDCGWTRETWHPDDPRHLEIHHIHMHAKGGTNTVENLVTLCNTCHDARHRKEKAA